MYGDTELLLKMFPFNIAYLMRKTMKTKQDMKRISYAVFLFIPIRKVTHRPAGGSSYAATRALS